MKNRATLLPVVFLLGMATALSQNSLQVINPNWWEPFGPNGTIEEAYFTISPQGAYMEIGMHLTFSARDQNFPQSDSVEVIFDFNLPSGAFVIDSWLWMFDDTTIVRADILEYRSALATYEDIVDRRRDPSILFRKGNGAYQLRVFPLPVDGTRKVKVTYLTPAVWSENTVTAWLPTEILQTSAFPLPDFQVITFPDSAWAQPKLTEYPDLPFESYFDPEVGNVLVADVPGSALGKALHFEVAAPFNENGVFVSQLNDGADQFYQLAYLPPTLPDPPNPKNLVVLFEHLSANSKIDKKDIFEYTGQMLQEHLGPEDQFNLIFSRLGYIEQISETWIPGDSNSISTTIAQLEDPISNQFNLPGLLSVGVDFIKNNGGNGDIILVTNSSGLHPSNAQYYSTNVLEQIGQDDISIHIVNYQNLNGYWDWDWNDGWEFIYDHRNLYRNLTTATFGNYYSDFEGTGNAWENLTAAFSSLKSQSFNYDLYPTMTNGFTFQRYYQTYLGQSQAQNQPILQIGKYLGDFPLSLEFTAASGSGFVFDSQIIDDSEIYLSDTLTREIWVGHYLRYLEGNSTDNIDIQEIIDISIAERVLSSYTAFLALDLEQGAEPCLYCWDIGGEILINTDEQKALETGIYLRASPNPFTDQCRLELELKDHSFSSKMSIAIFDAFGRQVAVIDTGQISISGKLSWTWDGRDRSGHLLPAGIYYLVVKTDKEVQSLKISLVR